MNWDDRGPGAQVGVADKSIELTPSLDQAGMDLFQTLGLLWGVSDPVAQGALLASEGAGVRTCLNGMARVTPLGISAQAHERFWVPGPG